MINTQGEEGSLRKKVWNTINLIQANQLFVHSKNIEIKYFDEVKNKTNIKIILGKTLEIKFTTLFVATANNETAKATIKLTLDLSFPSNLVFSNIAKAIAKNNKKGIITSKNPKPFKKSRVFCKVDTI